jgi:precorrin-3B synthase
MPRFLRKRLPGHRATLTLPEPLSHASSAPSSGPLRPSACPALSRIVAARDGGLCRIKLPGGELRAGQALAIADAALRHGSGIVELTNRANLQLRGVRAGHESTLTDRLLRAGLGPDVPDRSFDATNAPDASEPATATSMSTSISRMLAADDVRNVMVSPSAGRDAQALFDTRSLCAAILACLQSEPRFAALSPKFALLLDGGERLMMLDHAHDIWLSAMPARGGERWFAFGLAGSPSVEKGGALAAVPASRVPALVHTLLHAFLDLARPEDARMRHLLASHCADAIVRHVAARIDFPLRRDADVKAWRRAPADLSLRFGAHAQRAAGMWHVGGQPPLGRVDAATLRGLARLAQEQGNATLRMTPWQSVLLPDIADTSVPTVLAGFDALGIVRDPAHPLARLIACAGSTGCAKSHADTKADALHLAQRLPPGVEVHLSGCTRSCAAAHCAPHTLVAVEPGRYDLYRRTDPSNAMPAQTADAEVNANADAERRFGQRIAARLTIEQAAELLGGPARSHPHA